MQQNAESESSEYETQNKHAAEKFESNPKFCVIYNAADRTMHIGPTRTTRTDIIYNGTDQVKSSSNEINIMQKVDSFNQTTEKWLSLFSTKYRRYGDVAI